MCFLPPPPHPRHRPLPPHTHPTPYPPRTHPAPALLPAAKALDKINVAYWKADPKALADNNKDNHGISSQKFHLLKEFFLLGYSVLLSGARACAGCSRRRGPAVSFGLCDGQLTRSDRGVSSRPQTSTWRGSRTPSTTSSAHPHAPGPPRPAFQPPSAAALQPSAAQPARLP